MPSGRRPMPRVAGETGPHTGTTEVAEARRVAWNPPGAAVDGPGGGRRRAGRVGLLLPPGGSRVRWTSAARSVPAGWESEVATGIARVASVAAGASGTGVVGASGERSAPPVGHRRLRTVPSPASSDGGIPPDVVAAVAGPDRRSDCHRTAGHGDEHASQGVLSAFLGPARGRRAATFPRAGRCGSSLSPGMAHRIEVELTSQTGDATWTWRAAGAKQPRGTVDGRPGPGGCGGGHGAPGRGRDHPGRHHGHRTAPSQGQGRRPRRPRGSRCSGPPSVVPTSTWCWPPGVQATTGRPL